MRVLVENKRRVLAAAAALIVLIAIGFGIGKATGGSTAPAQAAPRVVNAPGQPTAASTQQTLSLRRRLNQAESAERRLMTQVAAGRRAEAQVRRVHRCQRHRGKRLARCLKAALPE